jgi:hypothetical protein
MVERVKAFFRAVWRWFVAKAETEPCRHGFPPDECPEQCWMEWQW